MHLPSLIPAAASVAERYITLKRAQPSRTYDYAKRGMFGLPVFETELHAPKCKSGESWIYFAVAEGANPMALQARERLYVGAQTQDRMFRGDGMRGENFHHAQMRAGNGSDTPHAFLLSGKSIVIYRSASQRLASAVNADPALARLRTLTEQPRTARQHLGWWYEQYVLLSEPGQWRWNTAPADSTLASLLGRQ
ncbi:hypothetical protein NYO99_11745 [Pelomonas sp. UHG3]|uniref:Uncharacterized protein n=1 Tax=Roseateles hydrophilus TaxID=2975054 RepID=A0ACC6CBA6_9BURK|nr:hypothetical protein [Pelomonas sp. UHG3]MCY4745647.1 hypothetical protein [Pelomonas sp. UHG3]